MIKEECYNLATSLFKGWVLIDSARRYANVDEKEKASMAIINAVAAAYDSVSEGALTESECKALRNDLIAVVALIEGGYLPSAKEQLTALSEQVFMRSLDKVAQCECKER